MQTVEDILQEKITSSKNELDTRAVTLYTVIENFAREHDCLYDFDNGTKIKIKELYNLLDEKVPRTMTNFTEITEAIKGTESNQLRSLADRFLNRSSRAKHSIPDVESIRSKVNEVFPAPVLENTRTRRVD